jgi:hypothetical protein
VAIAEIRSGNKVAYALEIERTNQQHAILVITAQRLARNRTQRMAGLSSAMRQETRMGIGRSAAWVSTQDHNPPRTG